MPAQHRIVRLATCAGAVVLLAACADAPDTTAPPRMAGAGVVATATGGGVFDAGVPVEFSFGAVQLDHAGSAAGNLRFSTALGGLAIEFHGEVTCMSSDLQNNRAWIGGVVTQNNSEHPAFTRDIHEVGKDIWFRVVDYGEGDMAEQPDRTTFVGFEGGAGIITSEEYCEVQPWPGPPDDVQDARTGPVIEGNIKVRG